MAKATVDMDKLLMDTASAHKRGELAPIQWWNSYESVSTSKYNYIKNTIKKILLPNLIKNFDFLDTISLVEAINIPMDWDLRKAEEIKEYSDLRANEKAQITKEKFEKITYGIFNLPRDYNWEIGAKRPIGVPSGRGATTSADGLELLEYEHNITKVWQRVPRPWDWNAIGEANFGTKGNKGRKIYAPDFTKAEKEFWGAKVGTGFKEAPLFPPTRYPDKKEYRYEAFYRNPLGGLASREQLSQLVDLKGYTDQLDQLFEKEKKEIEKKEKEERIKKEAKKRKFIIRPKPKPIPKPVIPLTAEEIAYKIELQRWNELEKELPSDGTELQKMKKTKIEELLLRLKEFTHWDRPDHFKLTYKIKLEKRLKQIEAIKGKGGRPKKDTTEIDKIKAEKKAERDAKKVEKEKLKAVRELKKQEREEEKANKLAYKAFEKQVKDELDAKKKKEKEDREKKTAERMAKKKTDPKKKPLTPAQIAYLARQRGVSRYKKK